MSEADQKTVIVKGNVLLAIELSNPSASADAHAVALFAGVEHGSELIGSMAIPDGIRSSDAVMVLVESLCAKHDVEPGDIARVLVSIGPGGYTALRIAATTGKVLAHTLGCSLVGVPTALVAAAGIEKEHRPALIALASKNQMAHCSIVKANGDVESVGVMDAERIESLGVRCLFGDLHLPASFVERARELGIEVCPIGLDARDCLRASEGIDPIEPIEFGPIYAREPDAVTQWRERKAK
ncbi:MAG: tRNA threonylcarbamoyladenosine biosynthesis protein TsaB [Phycisphaerales bacterium]|nr:tRNA threonylcarbamoyladenosine biosynthesis protein TsaB [Phycisphaerales bacterium]